MTHQPAIAPERVDGVSGVGRKISSELAKGKGKGIGRCNVRAVGDAAHRKNRTCSFERRSFRHMTGMVFDAVTSMIGIFLHVWSESRRWRHITFWEDREEGP